MCNRDDWRMDCFAHRSAFRGVRSNDNRFAMIRRDRHVSFILGGMLLVNVLTALASVSAVYVYRRRFHVLSHESLASCKASEKASVEASASALLLVDLLKDSQATTDGETYSAPIVRGFGQTRSRNAIYIYRDVEENGVVHREFIERIPFNESVTARAPKLP